VFQKVLMPLSASRNNSEAGGRNRMEPCMISSLLWYFCRFRWNDSTAHDVCQLCPQSWQLSGDQCYWLSKEKGTWMQGKKDCEDRESHLAVLRDKTEMKHINEITGGGVQLVWIGLTASKRTWKWVDNSSFSTATFDSLQMANKGCGTFKNKRLENDGCEGEHLWVCQKEPFHL
ncbi:KRBBC protein, partial [Anseranas semipalmata]|nr:KRBBC protein [Anseranas semipalmata]